MANVQSYPYSERSDCGSIALHRQPNIDENYGRSPGCRHAPNSRSMPI